MKLILYICLLFFSAGALCAQKTTAKPKPKTPKPRYSRAQFRKDSVAIMKPWFARPQIRIDNKISFYKGESYNIDGFDAGVLFKEKIRLTLGYYSLNDELSGYSRLRDGTFFDRQLKMQYGSVNVEFIYYNSRFFTFGIPLEFGFGENRLTYRTSPTDMHFTTSRGFVSLIDVGASGTFKPIRWVGIRVVGGLRRTLVNQVPGSRFDGPFISFGIAVNLREISKDVKMFMLKKKYRRLGDPVETAIDLITD